MLIPNLSKREKLILALCIGIIAAALLYNFILEPLVKKWAELDREIEIAKLKLKKSTEILKRQRQITEQYQRLSSVIKSRRASDEEELALLLNEIERLAGIANIHLADVKPRPVKELDYYKRYKVEVESEGDISKITKFVYEIQNSPHLLRVEKLSLNMKSPSDNLLKALAVITKIVP